MVTSRVVPLSDSVAFARRLARVITLVSFLKFSVN